MNLTGFSQETALNESGDTVFILTVPQAKFFLKSYYKSQELDSLLANCNEKVYIRDTTILNYEEIARNQSEIIINNNEVFRIKEEQIDLKNNIIEDKNSEIRKQKTIKIILIISLIVETLGFLYISV